VNTYKLDFKLVEFVVLRYIFHLEQSKMKYIYISYIMHAYKRIKNVRLISTVSRRPFGRCLAINQGSTWVGIYYKYRYYYCIAMVFFRRSIISRESEFSPINQRSHQLLTAHKYKHYDKLIAAHDSSMADGLSRREIIIYHRLYGA